VVWSLKISKCILPLSTFFLLRSAHKRRWYRWILKLQLN
jgi:hypothetical protein